MPPAVPTDVQVQGRPVMSRATIVWTDASGQLRYVITRSLTDNFAAGAVVATILQTVQLFENTGLKPGVDYWFFIQGDDGSGLSAPTASVKVTTFTDTINLDDIQQAIYDWALAASGKDVKWVYQDGAKLKKPFTTLAIISNKKTGQDDASVIEVDGREILGGQRVLTILVSTFGKDNQANDISEVLRTSLDEPKFEEFFHDRGIGTATIGDIIDVSSLLAPGTKSEAQSAFEVQFRKSSRKDVTDQVSSIETVQITPEGLP